MGVAEQFLTVCTILKVSSDVESTEVSSAVLFCSPAKYSR